MRDVLVAAEEAGGGLLDFVDGVEAGGDAAEDGVAVGGGIGGAEVEEVVVNGVDEELRGGGVDLGGAGHRDGVLAVLEAVVGLVADGLVGGLLDHVRGEAAALDHEAGDDAVADEAVVKAFVDVAEEVGDGDGRGGFVELQGDIAFVGLHDNGGHGKGSFRGILWHIARRAVSGVRARHGCAYAGNQTLARPPSEVSL